MKKAAIPKLGIAAGEVQAERNQRVYTTVDDGAGST